MALRAARWWPTFTVRRASLAYLWSFSSFFTLASVIFHVQNNFGALLVGWRAGPWQLGLFSRGQTLSGVPAEQIPTVAAAAAVPALSALRRRGRDLTQPYVRAHAASVTGAGILLGYLALSADFLVPRVYGPQWTDSVEILRYLCVAGLCAVVTGPSLWICYIIQRTDLLFRWQALVAVVTISAAIVGCRWQALGVAKALAVVGLALIVPTFLYGSRIGDIPLRATLRALTPGSLLAAAATVSALGVRVLLHGVDGGLGVVTFVGESFAFVVVVLAGTWALDRRGIALPGLDLALRRLGVKVPAADRPPVALAEMGDGQQVGSRM
jgi:PST family polysaccharide transporter